MTHPNPHPNPYVVEWADWLPYNYDDVPDDLVDLWAAAWAHDGIVDALMYGEWPCCRELTQHAYPGQPATRTRPPTKPCTCWYLCLVCGLDLTHAWCKQDGVDLTWCYHPASPVPHRATGFRINPTCPHHGRQVLILNPALPAELTIEALWNDPALNAMRDPYDLDDDERSGS